MAKQIALSKGKYAIVDDEDCERVINSEYKWYAIQGARTRTFYALGSVGEKQILMHRFILCAPDGMTVDHKDGNGLNNTRENIRIATMSQNNANKSLTKLNKSGYKGVHWDKGRGKWKATIRHKSIGRFTDPIDAARAYNKKALEIFGEFAKLNDV